MEEILVVENLKKHFEGVMAVDGIDMKILPKTITGLFGDNGAGKTTLFNLISGFELPDCGHIFFRGEEITHQSVLHRSKMGMGRLFQNPRVFSEVSVLDNLLAASKNNTGHSFINYFLKNNLIQTEERANKQKALNILDQFSISAKADCKAFELSVGERKLLSLGCLLMNDSQFILLDELTSGINNNMLEHLSMLIKDLNKDGITFLMIEHDSDFLKRICDNTYQIINGKLIKA